ncbi:MAG: hypothetical protein HY319_26590 [Armatimonadetes bacterium]|nr:hypothetical protein [Armatimonadota bacterium]
MRFVLIILLALWAPSAYADPPFPAVTVESDSGYNCHGLTFTGGREVVDQHAVPGESEVDNVGKIIRDQYHSVDSGQAQLGDIVVYDGPNSPSHTGLVVGRDGQGNLVILSKDGDRGDLKIHEVNDYKNGTTDQDWCIYRRNGETSLDPAAAAKARELLRALGFQNWDIVRRRSLELKRLLSSPHCQAELSRLERGALQDTENVLYSPGIIDAADCGH